MSQPAEPSLVQLSGNSCAPKSGSRRPITVNHTQSAGLGCHQAKIGGVLASRIRIHANDTELRKTWIHFQATSNPAVFSGPGPSFEGKPENGVVSCSQDTVHAAH